MASALKCVGIREGIYNAALVCALRAIGYEGSSSWL